MGKFASVNALSLPLVTDLVIIAVKDTALAISDLTIIVESFTPPSKIAPPPLDVTLEECITDALNAASEQVAMVFNSQFPFTKIPQGNVDFGAVLNYTKGGDIKTLENAICNDFNDWNINIDLAPAIAELLQPQADSSRLTPISTYGREPANNIDNPSQNLYWTASFAAFRLGGEIENLAVIYGFSAVLA